MFPKQLYFMLHDKLLLYLYFQVQNIQIKLTIDNGSYVDNKFVIQFDASVLNE